jgi:hypothetical protein
LGSFTLAGKVESQSIGYASCVAEGCARVVVGALWAEGHAEGHFSVGPYLTFQGLNGKDLILEEHLVLVDSLLDAGVLASEGDEGSLLLAFSLCDQFGLIVGVIGVETSVFILILFVLLVSTFDVNSFFILFLVELGGEALFLFVFLHFGGEGSP